MIYSIKSSDNKTLKLVRSLHRKKGRTQNGMYFAEGVRLTDEALIYADSVRFLLSSESYYNTNSGYFNRIDIDVYVVPDRLFDECCDTESPQGIAAVINIPEEASFDVKEKNYILILDGISEPGNMGTIIRTAEAAGIELIILMNNCTDIYSPKVVRSTMGSLFRMNFKHGSTDDIDILKDNGFTVAATALYNSFPIEKTDICGKRAVVIGSEAYGVSKEVLKKADIAVRIDMCGKVESLNAGVAAGIAMYMLRPDTEKQNDL